MLLILDLGKNEWLLVTVEPARPSKIRQLRQKIRLKQPWRRLIMLPIHGLPVPRPLD